MRTLLVVSLLLLGVGCAKEPEPLHLYEVTTPQYTFYVPGDAVKAYGKEWSVYRGRDVVAVVPAGPGHLIREVTEPLSCDSLLVVIPSKE